MMGQMMEMANQDSMMCSKMVEMMKNKPNVMKEMKKAANPKTEPKKEEHEQHHK